MDIQIVLDLTSLLPILRLSHSLIKFAQKQDAFICDFVAAVQLLKNDMPQYYIEPGTAFTQPGFWDFNALSAGTHDAIPTQWVTDEVDLNSSGIEYLTFTLTGRSIPATFRDPQAPTAVTREVLTSIIDNVKSQAKEATEKLVAQLTNRFPAAHLWMHSGWYTHSINFDMNFDRHLKILKEHYGSAKPFSTANHQEGQVEPMLSPTTLDMQSSLFKQCMKENSASMLKKPFNENPQLLACGGASTTTLSYGTHYF